MKLKAAILEAMATDQLRQCAEDFEVEVTDRRKRDVLVAALRRKRSLRETDLLEYLSEVDVKAVCEELEVSAKGRRGVLIERLLSEFVSAREEALDSTDVPLTSPAEDRSATDDADDSSSSSTKIYKIRLFPNPNVREMSELMRADAARALADRNSAALHHPISDRSSPMEKITAASAEAQSADIVGNNIDQLKSLFPEAFTEGRIDFEVLKQLLGGTVNEREEKYGLNWHGKRRARQLALTPSTGTLRPCQEESVDWDTTQNLMIEGDNLEVLKLLQKSYAGKVKLIYIDPPYNTGKDFVYPDNFQDSIKNYLSLTGQVEGGSKISSNTEASGRFHTDWLNMMYPRLSLSRNLLRDDGAIFVSIDDSELANLKIICDDIFGSECFAGCVTRTTGTPTGGGNRRLVNEIDNILIYFKSPDASIEGVAFTDEDASIYDKEDARGRYLIRSLRRTGGEDRREDRPTMFYPVAAPDGTNIYPIAPAGYESRWICGQERYREMERDGYIEWSRVGKDGRQAWQVYQKFYLEGRSKQPSNLWSGLEGNKKATRDLKQLFDDEKVFSFPKPVGLIQHVIQVSGCDEGIVLDFFAGSGTTGEAVMAQNACDGSGRRFILVQLPETLDAEDREQNTASSFCDKLGKPRNIAELTKERLRRAGKKIRKDHPESASDTGFRAFKLDHSNIRAWQPSGDLKRDLVDAVEHVVTGRSEKDVLTELLLKLGLDLCVPIESRKMAGKAVHAIGGGVLLTCLDTRITTADAEPLALGIAAWHAQLAPAGETTCVFRDSAFADDVAKTNLAAILQQHGIANVRSL